MKKGEAKQRIVKLKKLINEYRYEYHVNDKSTMPEAAADGLKKELTELEEQFPELITPDSPTRPSIPSTRLPQGVADADRDGVPDDVDSCLSSTRGYPVRENGCPLFDGVLSGVRFVEASTALTSESTAQLDFLVDMLANKHPSARIELHSHTDNEGDVRSQAILTRGRLKTIGMYLVDGGISANRIVLRSFGGSRPLFDNNTAEGRASNNRIEILERPR